MNIIGFTGIDWKWAAVFAALALLDFVWARYTLAITDKRAVPAGIYAVGILALGGFSVISYTTDHWLLIPACSGAFVGTFLAVKFGNKDDSGQSHFDEVPAAPSGVAESAPPHMRADWQKTVCDGAVWFPRGEMDRLAQPEATVTK